MSNERQEGTDAPADNPAGEVWTCPMHPEIRADQPGRCPKCKMFLVKAT
jgi:P-type Cu+ transporter